MSQEFNTHKASSSPVFNALFCFLLDSCFECLAVFRIIFAQHIINHAGLGYKVCTSYVKVLDLVCPHYFSGGAVTDTTKHITKLRQSHNIWIGCKKFFIVCACFYSSTSFSENVLSMAEEYAIILFVIYESIACVVVLRFGVTSLRCPSKIQNSRQNWKVRKWQTKRSFFTHQYQNSQ